MMVGIGKKYGFASNFDMLQPFTMRKTELPRKIANSQSDCQTASCIPSNELTLGNENATARVLQLKGVTYLACKMPDELCLVFL